jgi:hypothetical protein
VAHGWAERGGWRGSPFPRQHWGQPRSGSKQGFDFCCAVCPQLIL